MSQPNDAIRRVVRAYDDFLVRAYCEIRFRILRPRFLEEIGQYLPKAGKVLDVGCGFGLFGLYFSIQEPARSIRGVDLDARRLEMARRAAERLAIQNATYEWGTRANPWRPARSTLST